MKRYLFAAQIIILALLLPMFSYANLAEDVSSIVDSEDRSYYHDVNGLTMKKSVHTDMNGPLFSKQPSTLPNNISNREYLMNHALMANQQLRSKSIKILIDAGHGGRDPGSIGISEKEEKLYTLSLAHKVYDLLLMESSIMPLMTRTDDSYLTTQDRVVMANQERVDVFISLHANSFTNKKTRGTETYYYNRNSITLAHIIHELMVQAPGFPDRNVRKMDYVVIKETIMPAVLLEIGYLSNPMEEIIMTTESMQDKVANSIVMGIKQYIKSEL